MIVWVLFIFLTLNDGEERTIIGSADSFESNSKEYCLTAGKSTVEELVENKKIKSGLYKCAPIDFNKLEKALPPKV